VILLISTQIKSHNQDQLLIPGVKITGIELTIWYWCHYTPNAHSVGMRL